MASEENITCTIDLANQTDCNRTEHRGPSYRTDLKAWFLVSLGVSWILAFLIITLNIAVIRCILTYRKQSRLYFLLLHMAIADLVMGILDTSIHSTERTVAYIGYHRLAFYWINEEYSCKLQKALTSASAMASNFILAAASFDRAIAVARPMMSLKHGTVLQKVIAGGCWTLSLLLSIPLMVSFRVLYMKRAGFSTCINNNDVIDYETLIHYQFIVQVLLPLAVISASYVVLLRAIFRRAHIARNGEANSFSMTRVFNKGIPRSKTRSLKLMCGIVSAFFFSWTPFYVVNYLFLYGVLKGPSVMLLQLTYFLNGVANPVLFFVFHNRGKSVSRQRMQTFSSDLQDNTCGNSNLHSGRVSPKKSKLM